MPEYVYSCRHGHYFSQFSTVANHSPIAVCGTCGEIGGQVITAPSCVKVAADVHYTSPIDDSPITSWAARRNDLARHHCVPYDEGMKQDHLKRLEESDKQLDQAIEEHVERSVEKMSTKQRGKLYSELVEQSATLDVMR